MQFICMDIVGPKSISPVSSKGNRFCLAVIDMLTSYTIAVAIPNKSAETIVKTYMDHVYSIFGCSSQMFTDNGSEFKMMYLMKSVISSGSKEFTAQYTHHSQMVNWKDSIDSLKPAY